MALSVVDWLENLENVDPHECAVKDTHSTRKRRFGDTTETECARPKRQRQRQQQRARRPLGERTMSSAAARRSPRRRDRHTPPDTIANPSSSNATDEQTPRAPPPPPQFSVVNNAPDLSPTRSSATSRSTRTRSSSPSKASKASQLAAAVQCFNTQRVQFKEQTQQMPPEAAALVNKLKYQYARGQHVLPQRAKADIRLRDSEEEFDDAKFAPDAERDALGGYPSLDVVDEIVQDTNECARFFKNEAAWNAESHHPIGKNAWRNSRHKSETRWENVTTADIEPRDLLPENGLGKAVDGVRIDYAITLEESQLMKDCFPYLPRPSWNPTRFGPVAQTPMAVLVESKKKGADTQYAQHQLSVWAYALFRCLRHLRGDENHTEIPPIPMLIVEGETWELLIAVWDEMTLETTIWQCGQIAAATTRLGVYTLVAAIQYLIHYAEMVFRPWFEVHCCMSMPIED